MNDSNEFALNFATLLRALNLSGVELAAAMRVHKSAVRRWSLGATQPTGVNLARLSAYVATRVPGFTVADWDLAAPAFAQRLRNRGQGTSASGLEATAPGPNLRAFAVFRDMLEREAPVYAGFYMSYIMDSTADGRVVARACRVWRDGQRMRILLNGGEFEIAGEVFMSTDRVFVMTEPPRGAGLGLQIYAGSPRATPDLLIGAAVFNARDTEQSPTAAAAVAEFRGRHSGVAENDERTWRELVEFAASIRTPADAEKVPERIRKLLDYRVLGPHTGNQSEPLLRVPPSLLGRV
jgi:hypothetical protein